MSQRPINLANPYVGQVINRPSGCCVVTSVGSSLACIPGGSGIREATIECIAPPQRTNVEREQMERQMKYLLSLPPTALNRIGHRILARFDDTSNGDPYGWDWPTMHVIFPHLCQVWTMCKVAWRIMHPTA